VSFYDEHHRALQDDFDSRALADTLQAITVQPELDAETAEFLTGREFFFLATVRADGFPTVSHKGGPAGFVKVLDPTTVAFPSYDGNGMFLSMGNIIATTKVGLLFIDFETPHRVRLHGEAAVSANDELLGEFPGAELIVRVAIAEQFVNCPRYIMKHARVAPSPYVPDHNGDAPTATWKKIEGMSAVLPPADAERVAAEGEQISIAEYEARRQSGIA
jgi:predicted pyridoxine 5'-phosphate oxidase superfamily flavin-nucleotide-binding protein